MTNRLKALLVGTASLVCCISLVIGIIGATTGVAGAIALWLRRHEVAFLAGIGLAAIAALMISDQRPGSNKGRGGDVQ
ncbi:MAG: hypothetical protein ACRDZM_13385 [Acidimicrobiia bacterium]